MTGVHVVIEGANVPRYQQGDVATFSPEEAANLVNGRLARMATASDLKAAEGAVKPPEVKKRMVRVAITDLGSYNLGEEVLLDERLAQDVVAKGAAVFVATPPEASPPEPSPEAKPKGRRRGAYSSPKKAVPKGGLTK